MDAVECFVGDDSLLEERFEFLVGGIIRIPSDTGPIEEDNSAFVDRKADDLHS